MDYQKDITGLQNVDKNMDMQKYIFLKYTIITTSNFAVKSFIDCRCIFLKS